MLTNLPYRPLKRLLRAIRIRYYTVDWPDVPAYDSDVDPADLEARLRAYEGWEGMLISYKYDGEVLNLRKPAGVDADGRQLELHIRGRRDPDGDGYQYVAHREPSRYEHKTAHIESDGLEWLDENEVATLIGDTAGG